MCIHMCGQRYATVCMPRVEDLHGKLVHSFTMWELEIKNWSSARQWAPIFTAPSHLPKGVAYTFKILTIFLANNYRFKN